MSATNAKTERNVEMRRRRVTEGLTLEELGIEYGLSRERVRQICGPCTENQASVKAKKRMEQVEELAKQGIRSKAIAEQLGLNIDLVYKYREKLGLSHTPMTKEQRQEKHKLKTYRWRNKNHAAYNAYQRKWQREMRAKRRQSRTVTP